MKVCSRRHRTIFWLIRRTPSLSCSSSESDTHSESCHVVRTLWGSKKTQVELNNNWYHFQLKLIDWRSCLTTYILCRFLKIPWQKLSAQWELWNPICILECPAVCRMGRTGFGKEGLVPNRGILLCPAGVRSVPNFFYLSMSRWKLKGYYDT